MRAADKATPYPLHEQARRELAKMDHALAAYFAAKQNRTVERRKQVKS